MSERGKRAARSTEFSAAEPSAPTKHVPARDDIGSITHTDLASLDPVATKAWCAKVLGWQFRPPFAGPGGDLHFFAYADERGGVVRPVSGEEPPGSIPYVRVADVQAAYDRALAEGAEEMLAPTRASERLTVAIVRAPGGVPIGITGP